MDDDEGDPQPPEQVTHLWNCVKKALEANNNPTAREIDRWAAVAGEKLAATTVDGWFKTWSVVPTWDRFNALIKALAAEDDEDWKTLHDEALTADRKHKKEERKRGEPSRDIRSPKQPLLGAAHIQADPQPAGAAPDTPVENTARGIFGVKWTVAALVSFAILTPVILGALFLSDRSGSTAEDPTGVEPYPDSQPSTPVVQYCTYVIKEPAGVYAAPDANSEIIKFKYLNEKIGIVDRPHPPGWIAVRTPQNDPGFNWMKISILAPLVPCRR